MTIISVALFPFWVTGALYVFSAAAVRPWFDTHIALNWLLRQRYEGSIQVDTPISAKLLAGLVWLSIAVFLWYAVYPIIDLIPYGWGSHEDGEWNSLRDGARLVMAGLGCIILPSAIEHTG